MRRLLSMLVASAMLGGCSGLDPFASHQTFSAPGKCGALARQRLDDAIINGQATGSERAIFNFTYEDCLKAEARFGPPPEIRP